MRAPVAASVYVPHVCDIRYSACVIIIIYIEWRESMCPHVLAHYLIGNKHFEKKETIWWYSVSLRSLPLWVSAWECVCVCLSVMVCVIREYKLIKNSKWNEKREKEEKFHFSLWAKARKIYLYYRFRAMTAAERKKYIFLYVYKIILIWKRWEVGNTIYEKRNRNVMSISVYYSERVCSAVLNVLFVSYVSSLFPSNIISRCVVCECGAVCMSFHSYITNVIL